MVLEAGKSQAHFASMALVRGLHIVSSEAEGGRARVHSKNPRGAGCQSDPLGKGRQICDFKANDTVSPGTARAMLEGPCLKIIKEIQEG